MVKITLLNESKIRIDAENSVLYEIRDHFTFFVPGYKFMPKFRAGIWDGKIRIFDIQKQELPSGLWSQLKKLLKDSGYQYEIVKTKYGSPEDKTQIDPNEIMSFIKKLNLTSKGNPIEIRDYQFDAICASIQQRRILLLSPTGSGKSLIIYCFLRWCLENLEGKILLIVPTTNLVDQMYLDFEDYSMNNDFVVSENCHKIYSGQTKTNVYQRIFISTWQSIYKLPNIWFEQFSCVVGDEAHLFSATSLNKSMDKAKNAKYRIGTTGTLNGTVTHEMVLTGTFGPVVQFTTTKKLQDNDTLAKLKIFVLDLDYSEKLNMKLSYQKEISYLIGHEKRNKIIRNIALNMSGNTLVLFQFVEKHGKILFDLIRQKAGDRKVFFVSGEVEKDIRDSVRSIVENEKDSIIVASIVFSTGVNIRNLHNIILASPTKSQIKLLQTIGRGLRKSTKDTTFVDFTDNLYDNNHSYSVLHGIERMKIYNEQQFSVKRMKFNV